MSNLPGWPTPWQQNPWFESVAVAQRRARKRLPASLYAAVTVLLARFILGERLAPSQRAGVLLALVGVSLIAAGA